MFFSEHICERIFGPTVTLTSPRWALWRSSIGAQPAYASAEKERVTNERVKCERGPFTQ
jgi:hypothetical protein